MSVDSPKNGIISAAAMAEKRLENGKVRYLAAYPTGAERFKIFTRWQVAVKFYASFA